MLNVPEVTRNGVYIVEINESASQSTSTFRNHIPYSIVEKHSPSKKRVIQHRIVLAPLSSCGIVSIKSHQDTILTQSSIHLSYPFHQTAKAYPGCVTPLEVCD
jgi:hypothetical protein